MSDKFYDGVIIGGGPAGLAAAIYLARARYRVLVIEKETRGGQITITSEVVNYPGVLHTDGKKLTEEMRKQAQNFGAEFLKAQVTGLVLEGDKKKILTDKGEIQALGVVLATGASPRQAGFTGEEEFRGRGVAYCATCDGEFFRRVLYRERSLCSRGRIRRSGRSPFPYQICQKDHCGGKRKTIQLRRTCCRGTSGPSGYFRIL